MVEKGANGVDSLTARLAANQHGVVSLDQLRRLGVGAKAAAQRAKRGRLHRVHRGVYAVGHAGLSIEGRWMAAVLAVGADAVLSHASAAALWRLTPTLHPPAFNAVVEVTVPGGGGKRKRSGIRVHRSTTLTDRDTTRRRNIPVTTPARTLEDLKPGLSMPQFHAALRQAEIRGYDVSRVAAPGAPTRSELERAFLRLCRRHRLPEPEVNAAIGTYQADFLWRDARLIAEVDSYGFHRGRGAFELDRRREADLAAAGYEVLRFTWQQVTQGPAAVVAAVRARLLARSG